VIAGSSIGMRTASSVHSAIILSGSEALCADVLRVNRLIAARSAGLARGRRRRAALARNSGTSKQRAPAATRQGGQQAERRQRADLVIMRTPAGGSGTGVVYVLTK